MAQEVILQVWVKIDGPLSVLPAASDGEPVESNWAIGPPTSHAREVLEFAKELAGEGGQVIVYGTPVQSPQGQRRAQRWLSAEGLADLVYWVDYTPPDRTSPTVEVIDQWPIESTPSNSVADRATSTPLS